MADNVSATVTLGSASPTKAKKEKAHLHFEDEAGLFRTVCRTFMHTKKCTRAGCKFVHDKQLCAHFWKSGHCKFNDECRKNHYVTTLTSVKSTDKDVAVVAAAVATSIGKMPQEKKSHAKKARDKSFIAKTKKVKEETTIEPVDKQDVDKKVRTSKKNERRQATIKNTESFEPMTKPVDLRIAYDLGSKNEKFTTSLTSRDLVIAPNLFSDYEKGELYTKLMHELDNCGIPREQLLKMWHGNDKIDGTHLIVDDHSSWKARCPTFELVTDRLKNFFSLDIKATRFNWYKDTSQWKPFHFDAAAVKPHIAAIQNFTVGISFGATRDAAFEHAKTKTVVSVPQPDGCVYAFSKDTNIIWRHGILQDVPVRKEGRISVIAWGWVDDMKDVVSPPAAVL